jgi:hypothetical protein
MREATEQAEQLAAAAVRPVDDLVIPVLVVLIKRIAVAPYVSLTRNISLTMMSRASSQLIRSYLLTPRFWMLRPPGPTEPGAPAGSKSTRFMGKRIRAGE